MSHETSMAVLFAASLLAGAMNSLAGGGTFVTFPALLVFGLDPRAANVTSTIALFPGQAVSGWAGRRLSSGTATLPLPALCAVSLLGGAAGAGLLLVTPAGFFARLVPWLVLFATVVFAWGSFGRKPAHSGRRVGRTTAVLVQFAISVYGGYFGGGIGFLMLAALTAAGLAVRAAGATKNLLAGMINASAVVVLLLSPDVHWDAAAIIGGASVLGGLAGVWALRRVPERLLRGAIVAVGVAVTVGLFVRLA